MAIIGGQDHVSSRTLIQLLSKHLKIEAISYILRRQEVNLHTLIKALTLGKLGFSAARFSVPGFPFMIFHSTLFLLHLFPLHVFPF